MDACSPAVPQARILVVDDEPSVVEMCTGVLAQAGYLVYGASGGPAALARLEGEHFDLLLVDIMMPGVDGLTVLQRARELDPNVTAVIITGYGTLQNAIRSLRIGARDFVLKPFGAADLLSVVNQVLEKRRQEQENLLLRARLPILEISQALMTKGDVAFLAERLLEAVVRQIEADQASLLLLDEQAGELYTAGAIGLPTGVADTTRVPVGPGFAGWVLRREGPLVLDEAADLEPSVRALLVRPGVERTLDIAATVCALLRTREQAVGVLTLSRLVGHASFTSGDLSLLSIMGGQIAIALENARLYEAVQRELTERQRAEAAEMLHREALQESERKLRSVIEQSGDGIVLTDEQGTVVKWNRAMERITGQPRAEVLGRPLWDVQFQTVLEEQKTPAAYEQLKATIQHFFQTGQGPWLNQVLEHEFRRPDGALRILQTMAFSISAAGGWIAGSISRDITERKRAEEALRKAHDELERRVAERTADLVRTSEELRLEIAERQRTEEELQQRNRELTLLHYAGQALGSTLDLDQVLAIVLDGMRHLLDVAACSVWLTDSQTNELVCRQVADPQGRPVLGWRLALGQEIAGHVALTGESVIVPDAQLDPRHLKDVEKQAGLTLHSILCVPLQVRGRVVGVIEAIDTTVDRFTTADLAVMEPLAASAAIAIENARLFEAVSEQREQLRALAARLAEAEETERQRLAQELHDQVGQNLTALGINLSLLRSQWPAETASHAEPWLEDCLALVKETGGRIRDVMADLRPPVLDDYGLVAALRWYGERVAARTALAVDVQGEEPEPRLAAPVEIALFRVAQEALTNVVKHAQAIQVTVAVEAPAADTDLVRLIVTDDGVGFDPAHQAGHQGWGLITMTERAEAVGGRCRIESSPGAGTQVVVEVPR